MRRSAIVLAMVLWSATTGRAGIITGPDGFGHVAVEIGSNLRDVSATGIVLGISSVDDSTELVALPAGFSFSFYGVPITDIRVSTNGQINIPSSDTDSNCCGPTPLPSPTGPSGIYGFQEDLDPGDGGDIVVDTLGAVGSREFVVGFYGIPFFPADDPDNTFEMILHESSNNIEFQYSNITSVTGDSVSIGIMDQTNSDGLQILFGNPVTGALGDISNRGFLISAVPEPASVAIWCTLGIMGAISGGRRRRTK